MELSKQVCTLEQAKKLKELGLEQNSLYYYYSGLMTEKHGIVDASFLQKYYSANACYSLFTVAELGAMLPEQIPTNSNIRFAELVSRKDCLQWTLGYDVDTSTMGGYGADVKSIYRGIISDNINEAQCRAAMLIYLLENNLITKEDCNTRLNSN